VIGWALESDLERTAAAVRDTRTRIAPHIRRTPLVEADGPQTRLLKLESLQHGGSFKVRGAAAAITAARPAPREVIAASTGNHALAVAAIARALAIPCRILVPSSAAPVKLARLRAAAVEVVEVDGDPLHAELAAREVAAAAPGALVVSPYNDRQVILGQATVGLELLEQAGRAPDALFVPVGGGGLVAGIALAVREAWPDTAIVGCAPAASPAMADAVAAGRVVDSPLAPTLSDATAGNIEAGSITVPICSLLVDEWVLVGEDEIAQAMRTLLCEHHLVAEGAGALALAASLRRGGRERHLIIVSGAGVGEDAIRAMLEHQNP
jgi:threonine dehydratase